MGSPFNARSSVWNSRFRNSVAVTVISLVYISLNDMYISKLPPILQVNGEPVMQACVLPWWLIHGLVHAAKTIA